MQNEVDTCMNSIAMTIYRSTSNFGHLHLRSRICSNFSKKKVSAPEYNPMRLCDAIKTHEGEEKPFGARSYGGGVGGREGETFGDRSYISPKSFPSAGQIRGLSSHS